MGFIPRVFPECCSCFACVSASQGEDRVQGHQYKQNVSGPATGHIPVTSIHGLHATQDSALRHWATGHLYQGDTKLSMHETPALPWVSKALWETVTGSPNFFYLVWQCHGCSIHLDPMAQSHKRVCSET